MDSLASFIALGIAILGVADIAMLRVERLFFAAGDPGAQSWNQTQRAIARRYWWARCGGELLLLVMPGLLAFFQVIPAWCAFAGLGVYFPIGYWLLRWVQRAVPQAAGANADV